MKRNSIITIVLSFCALIQLNAQTGIDRLLQSIEENNTQLKALRELSSAEKIGNKTANNLSNPEVEITHMPKARGNAAGTEIEATQAFDFPTVYKHRGDVIGIENEKVDLAYEIRKREILNEARKKIVEYVFLQKQLKYMVDRVTYARDLYRAYEKLFDEGEINILERNKTKLNLLEAEKDLQEIQVNLESTRADLERMNGGRGIDYGIDAYSLYQLPLDFEEWYIRVKNNNPALLMADKSIEASKKQEQLQKSLNLPKLTAGYVGDLEKNNKRHGFKVGVSIPLWGGRNTVKSQKALTTAMQFEKEDAELQYRNMLKSNFEKAKRMSIVLREYSEVIDNSNNFLLLKKSFDMGQLGLIEYLQELMIYNDAVTSYYATERDYFLVLSELEQWEN